MIDKKTIHDIDASIMQHWATKIVDMHIHHCASHMVSELASKPDLIFDSCSFCESYHEILEVQTGEEDEYGDLIYDEVYEHWIVSDWLAEKLTQQDQATAEVFDFNIWGRCTTGQSICLDSCIQRIALDLWYDSIVAEDEAKGFNRVQN